MTFNDRGDIILSTGKHVACMSDMRAPWRAMILDENRTLTTTECEEIYGHMVGMWGKWMHDTINRSK